MFKLKYLLLGFICLSIANLFAENHLIQTDTICTGYYIDESTPLPFSPVLALNFGIPDSALVTVEVHKVENNERKYNTMETLKIKTLLYKKLSKGMYQIHWDGTDSTGNKQIRNDQYIYYIKIDRKTYTLFGEGYVKMEAKTRVTSPY